MQILFMGGPFGRSPCVPAGPEGPLASLLILHHILQKEQVTLQHQVGSFFILKVFENDNLNILAIHGKQLQLGHKFKCNNSCRNRSHCNTYFYCEN